MSDSFNSGILVYRGEISEPKMTIWGKDNYLTLSINSVKSKIQRQKALYVKYDR